MPERERGAAVSAFWVTVHWVHLLAMAFFVGGQLFLAAIVLPVLRGRDERSALREVARRFGAGTLWAIGVLAISGFAMASHDHQWGDWHLQVKLGLVLAVGGLVLWHMRRPDLHALEGAVFLGSLAIVWLGLALAH